MSATEQLRWKYKINADVDETAKQACRQGFSVRFLEGEPRGGGEPFPLGQIEIKGGKLGLLNVKVVVGPHVTQVYIMDQNAGGIKDVDGILNDIVVRAQGETTSFGEKTRAEVQTTSMLRLRQELIGDILKLQDEEHKDLEHKLAQAELDLEGDKLKRRLDELVQEELTLTACKLQKLEEKGVSGVEKKIAEFKDACAILARWDTELAQVNSEGKRFEVLKRHSNELNQMALREPVKKA